MGIAIIVGIISYPLVNGLTKKFGKKTLIIGACIVYIVIYTSIFFNQALLPIVGGRGFGILIGLFIGFPISITNILPLAAFADIAQYDTIKSGENRAGMFVAARNFTMQLSQSIVLLTVPGVIALNSVNAKATASGVRLTAILAAAAISAALILYCFYDDKAVTGTIDEYNQSKEQKLEQPAPDII